MPMTSGLPPARPPQGGCLIEGPDIDAAAMRNFDWVDGLVTRSLSEIPTLLEDAIEKAYAEIYKDRKLICT